MRTINICISMIEMDYGTALAGSLLRVNRFFSITDQPMACCDLLLTDDLSRSSEKMVFFTDEKSEEKVDINRKIFIIYKYQHAGSISKILKLAHSLFSETEMISEVCEAANILSVCSSGGGTGCTSVAMGLCMELGKFHGKRVLYLCLEEFESTNMLIPGDAGENQNITGYLYRVLHGPQDKIPSVSGYLIQNEFDICAFRPSRGRNPLRELNESEFVRFMNAVLREDLFSDVVIDCSNGIDDAVAAAMKLSRKVCHVAGESISQARMQSYMQTAALRTCEKEQTEWIFVSNSTHSTSADFREESHSKEKTETAIPFDKSSFRIIGDQMMIDTDKSFGRGVQHLLAQLRCSNG